MHPVATMRLDCNARRGMTVQTPSPLLDSDASSITWPRLPVAELPPQLMPLFRAPLDLSAYPSLTREGLVVGVLRMVHHRSRPVGIMTLKPLAVGLTQLLAEFCPLIRFESLRLDAQRDQERPSSGQAGRD